MLYQPEGVRTLSKAEHGKTHQCHDRFRFDRTAGRLLQEEHQLLHHHDRDQHGNHAQTDGGELLGDTALKDGHNWRNSESAMMAKTREMRRD